MLSRRSLLSGAAVVTARAKSDFLRISAITDEIGRTPEDSIAFARQYGLKWVELRSVPGRGGDYASLPEAEVRSAAARLADSGLRVSFLNTGMLKYPLPGTEPAVRRQEAEEARQKRKERGEQRFANRLEELRKAIAAAHLFGVDKVRVFTFSRVAAPEKLMPRIADIIGEMCHLAARERIHLLVENETSCNVGTCAELAALMKRLPSPWAGINWDALNGAAYPERPFRDGYALLPKGRIGNVQIKGKSVLDTPERLDWQAIMEKMGRDGYRGCFGLETHIFDGTLIESSHRSMREIMRIVKVLETRAGG